MKDNVKLQSTIFITILIILISCNLRAPITGVGSLINTISDELELSSGAAGMLTTIPLLAFAAISPVAAYAADKIGAGRLFIISFAVLTCGIVIRSAAGKAGLFTGSVLIGAAIAVGNVLLPAVIKSKFPDRIASMTSLYTVLMQVVSAASTAISLPLSFALGWSGALGIWIIPAALTLVFCFFNRTLSISRDGERKKASEDDGRTHTNSMYKAPMTWWITFYMGVQSMMFYCFIAWLSPMLQYKGYDDVVSGYMLSVYVIMGMVGSAVLPAVMRKNKSQSATGVLLGALYLLGMVGMLMSSYVPMLIIGIVLCGFCSGTCISFSMALFGLHTSNGNSASKLSGTAQSAGYLIAAAGPVMLGKALDATGSWTLSMLILSTAAIFLIIAGKIVGRDEIIE